MRTTTCATCTHDADQHTPMAGCLVALTDSDYCPCAAYAAPGATIPTPEAARAVGRTIGRVRAQQAAAVTSLASGYAEGLAEGRRLADEGSQAAGSAAPGALVTDWRLKANEALETLITNGGEFSADDLVDLAGMPPVANMLGGVFRVAAQQDRIRAVGFTQSTRPAAHARVQRTWKGA